MLDIIERRFLRFAGKLWETGEFEPGVGWETVRIARRPSCAPGYSLELVDDAGNVLVETGVELSESACRVQGTRGMTGSQVIGYLPLHAKGHTIIFRQSDRILHRTEIAASPPRIAITGLEIDKKGCVHIRWEAEHDRRLKFNIVFVDAKQRTIPVARELSDNHLLLETADLPGDPGCSIAVLATDGLRSAMARSERFDLPEQPPRLMILLPNDGDSVAPDQPISLLGHAHGAAGQALPDDELIWSVDGQIVARGQRMAPAGPFEPGLHRLELAYLAGSEVGVRSHVEIHVAERSPEQRAWRAIAASLSNASHRIDGNATKLPVEKASNSSFPESRSRVDVGAE